MGDPRDFVCKEDYTLGRFVIGEDYSIYFKKLGISRESKLAVEHQEACIW